MFCGYESGYEKGFKSLSWVDQFYVCNELLQNCGIPNMRRFYLVYKDTGKGISEKPSRKSGNSGTSDIKLSCFFPSASSACSAVLWPIFFLDISGTIMTKYIQQYPPSLSTMLKLAGYFLGEGE